MKKILTLPTVIVFLMTILVAGSCGKTHIKADVIDNPKKVKIYLKAVEKGGTMHLEMYDTNYPDSVMVDSLRTWVWPGMTVKWKLDRPGGIQKIDTIVSKEDLFKDGAHRIFLSKGFKLIIPDEAEAGPRQKYDIEFVDSDGNIWEIDPYLKIPHTE